MDEATIACTLGADDFKTRVAWIGELNANSLLRSKRDNLRLELVYRGDALADVRELVRREQHCCAFLAFDLRQDADCVRLNVTAPEEARDAADYLFEYFQSREIAASANSCACC